MIKGKLVFIMCVMVLVFILLFFVVLDMVDGYILKLVIGFELMEGFDFMLGWSYGSYLLFYVLLFK